MSDKTELKRELMEVAEACAAQRCTIAMEDWLEARLATIQPTAGQDVLDVAQIIAIVPDFIGLALTDIGELIEFAHAVRRANNPLPAVAPADAVRDAEDLRRYREINTPEIADFVKGVEREALHQRERWNASHDAGKAPEDWFWLLGYLGGKALHAAKTGDTDKALHHTISSAAALLNWHAAILGAHSAMRPGIDPSTATPKEPAK